MRLRFCLNSRSSSLPNNTSSTCGVLPGAQYSLRSLPNLWYHAAWYAQSCCRQTSSQAQDIVQIAWCAVCSALACFLPYVGGTTTTNNKSHRRERERQQATIVNKTTKENF